MNRLLALCAFLFVLPATALAEKFSFDVDSKFINIAFESKMDVEDILGTTHSAKGSATLGADDVGTFEITVPVASLRTGIDLRDEHLRSDAWLDAKKFPDITFSGKTAKAGAKHAVTGTFTMHGVSKPLSVQVEARRIPADAAKKANLGPGNWLRVRAEFKVKIADFGIKVPKTAVAKVANEWTVRVSLFAKEVP